MKKIILTVAAVFAFGFANAQENVQFGAKAGVNMSNFNADSDSDSKIGIQLGAFAELKVSDKFAIQPELLFSAVGAKQDIYGTTNKFNLNYLVLPVMAKYYVVDKFSLEAGPQIGFLISAKTKLDGESVDDKDMYKSVDFGLNLGAGYDVAKNINIGLRYSLGLSNISDIDGYDVKTSNIALAVGYKF